MQDLIVSLSANKIRVSYLDPKEGLKSYQEEVTNNVVSDCRIKDIFTFSSILDSCISKVSKAGKSKLLLNIVVEPQDTFLSFFSLPKGFTNDDAAISEIKKSLEGEDLEGMYFSYQKIAPFIYQFVGIKKEVMDPLLEVANNLKVGIRSVIPWVLLLPRYVKTNEPAVFVVKRDDKQVVCVSELNGIFFTTVNALNDSTEDLEKFIKQVPFFRDTKKVSKIQTLNYESFALTGYETVKINLPVSNLNDEENGGFEINLLTHYLLDSDPQIVTSQGNLLNCLPLPAVVKKTPVPALVSLSLVAAVFLGVFFVFKHINLKNGPNNNLAQNTPANQVEQEVLSETDAKKEATESQNTSPVTLNKTDLKIRVENGAGVAGLAAKTKDMLVGLTYTVLSIDTADIEQKDTLFRFKKSKEGYKDLIVADTKSKFGDIVVKNDLDEKTEYDLLIVIGGNADL